MALATKWKRQRRKEKLYEKACRMKSRHQKREVVVLPGQGAEKMKRMGEGLCRARGETTTKRVEGVFSAEEGSPKGGHILSY